MRRLKRLVRDLISSMRSLTHVRGLAAVRAARRSPRYLLYLLQQTEKSQRYVEKPNPRADQLIGLALAQPSISSLADGGNGRVLCIGCRNARELDLFENGGFARVQGIDLFSVDPRIAPMDMHAMTFPDYSFDLVYSCHSLEHAFDPTQVASEIRRVLRPGGACVIEVPVQFSTSLTDRQDYGSAQGVMDLFAPAPVEVLVEENALDVHGTPVARALFHLHRMQPQHA